jgi:hypothetical protein
MTAKLIITDDNGKETIIEDNLGPQTPFSSMSSIESFVGSLKTAILPQLEQELLKNIPLTDAQEQLIKKKTVLSKYM